MPGIVNLISQLKGGRMPALAQAYIIPIGPKSGSGEDVPLIADTTAFQYFPESVSDTRGTDYQTKPIPGLSHPLYQWTSGSAREISFTAHFSRDRAELSLSEVRIAEGFTGERDDRNVDISGAILWLRSFTYPEYSTDGQKGAYKRPKPPRRLILGLQGVKLGAGQNGTNEDEIYCVMTRCDVTRSGFFNNGTVRLATVDLSFAEVIQQGNSIRPIDAKWLRDASNYVFPVRSRAR